MSRLAPPVVAIAAVALVASACGDADDSDDAGATADDAPTSDEAAGDAGGGDVTVVATTTPLGDVVGRVVACGGGTTTTLMPIGADPHDFSPSSAEVAEIVAADLVVANGLALEEGLADALAGAEEDGATVFEVAPEVDPIEFAGGHSHDHGDEDHDHGDEDHDHGDGDHDHGDETHSDEDHAHSDGDHDHGDETHSDEEHAHDDEAHSDEGHSHEEGSLDPHFWHDVSRMGQAAEIVGAALAEETGDDAYAACGTDVSEELAAVDAEVRETLDAVPAERRVLVTDHDAFGYFAAAYDFEVVGTVIPAGTTLAEPSSAELAELVETLRAEQVPAVFANLADASELVDAVAAEAGSEVEVVSLFVGSLGEDGSGAETYDGMVTTNAQLIADALSS